MTEWSSYRIQDFLLFSRESLLDIMEAYNSDFWPWQLLWLGVAGLIFVMALVPSPGRLRIILALVAAGWAWVAFVFHLQYFLPINWAARYAAGLFFVESVLLFLAAAIPGKWVAHPSRLLRISGLTLYALAAFVPLELLGKYELTHIMVFGWGPERTALGTLGLLLSMRIYAFTILLMIPALLALGLSVMMFYGLR